MKKESLLANIFQDNIPQEMPEEFLKELISTNTFRVEQVVSKGHSSSEGHWYDQEKNEWVLVIKGAGILEFDGGEKMQLNVGDYVNIPAHKKHRVSWTDPEEETVWLTIVY